MEAVLIVKSQQKGFVFWDLVEKGAKEAAKEFHVNLTVYGPETEEDIDVQIDMVQKAIEKKPDAIILAAVDKDRLQPAAQKIKDAGIKLILVDSGLSESIEDCFVGTDNFTAAQMVGQNMGRAMDGRGDIIIISHRMNTSTSVERREGFRFALKNFPDIQIVNEYDTGDSAQASMEKTLEVLAENPEIDGIYATNQISAEGVTAALKKHGKPNIKFFAFDSSNIQNEALEQGYINGFAVQKPFNMGYMSVKAAVEAQAGTIRKKTIDTGCKFATQENMRDEEIQKLIYPFV